MKPGKSWTGIGDFGTWFATCIAFELDPEQIDLLMKRLPNAAEQAFGDLHAFADTLDRMADSEM